MHPVRIDCSGWSYDDWRGDLYPDGMPQRCWLAGLVDDLGLVVRATGGR